MAKDYAKSFYTGKKWRSCRESFMISKGYICEECEEVATICHHKTYINESNITDPNITLNWDNLQSVCQECHNRIHGNRQITRQGLYFDEEGNLFEK